MPGDNNVTVEMLVNILQAERQAQGSPSGLRAVMAPNIILPGAVESAGRAPFIVPYWFVRSCTLRAEANMQLTLISRGGFAKIPMLVNSRAIKAGEELLVCKPPSTTEPLKRSALTIATSPKKKSATSKSSAKAARKAS